MELTVVFLLYLFYPLVCYGAAPSLPTTVTISPAQTTVGKEVTLQCDFELFEKDDGTVKDLLVLYWDIKGKGNVLTFTKATGVTQIGEDYAKKISDNSHQYIETPDSSKPKLRRHILKMKVDNCDSAIFKCRMYNADDYVEGVDEKELEVEPKLPEPTISCCNKESCKSEYLQIFGDGDINIVVKCGITDASVSPILSLTHTLKGDETSIGNPQEDNRTEGCLYDANNNGTKTIAGDDPETHKFTCTVNYPGKQLTSSCEVGTTKVQSAQGQGGVTGGKNKTAVIAVGVLIPILIILLVIFFLLFCMRRRRQALLDDTDGDSEKVALNGLNKPEASNSVIILFKYASNSEFSNIYKCNITIDGVDAAFNCPEQFRYYRTAELAGDKEAMEAVLKSNDVNKMREITSKIQLPAEKRNSATIEALQRAMKAKFTQHEHLQRKLQDTGDKILAETSRLNDTYYSIGISIDHENAFNPDKWPGQNITGILLRKVREEIKNETQNETPTANPAV